jgi:hypothetical protein
MSVTIFLGALLVPATGLTFGLLAFYQSIKGWRGSELKKATAAGALCMYVRSKHWPPREMAMNVCATVSSNQAWEGIKYVKRRIAGKSHNGEPESLLNGDERIEMESRYGQVTFSSNNMLNHAKYTSQSAEPGCLTQYKDKP